MIKAKLDFEAAKEDTESIQHLNCKEGNTARCFLEILKQNEEMRECVEFYGDLDNYDKANGSIYDMQPKGLGRKLYRVLEFGDRARAVLERHKERIGSLE